MSIKSAIHDSGIPIKIIPFSPEMLTNVRKEDAFQDVLLTRINTHFNSYKYMKLHEEFETLISELENGAPEFKEAIAQIDDIVVSKETQCFDEGYKAGMIDLMTALTFNDLQITQTQLVDCEAIDKIGKEKGAQCDG